MTMNITVQRNKGANRLEIPYIAEVEVPHLHSARRTFSIPVYASYIGMKKTLAVEICGFRMQTQRFEEVSVLVERLINALINSARLPTYVFIARLAQIVYPVYTVGDEVYAVTPRGGPILRHVELAKVREYLTDYLHDSSLLGAEGQRDKLHVRGVNGQTLELHRPIFYLKKRITGQTDFWAPVFSSSDGRRIYTYAASAKRETPVNDGREILTLRDLVAHLLIQDKRLKGFYDLRPDRLFPETWHALEAQLEPVGDTIHVMGMALPVYQTRDETWVSAELRPDEERYNLYLGATRDELMWHICQNLERRGV